MVDVKLVRWALSGRSSAVLVLFLLAKPPEKLEPGVTEDLSHSMSPRELPRCHATSGPLFAAATMSARCFGGSGGRPAPLMFGIGIGTDEVERGEIELVKVGRARFEVG
jgi:hypothetical protein